MAVWQMRLNHKWREFWAAKYTGLGEVEIRKIPDHDLVYRVFDYVFQNWMHYDESRLDYSTEQLNPAEKALWFAWDVDCEINNGGFNQYFFNKRTRPVDPVLEAYQFLGASEHLAVFKEAIDEYAHVIESHVSVLKRAKDDVPKLLEEFSATYTDNPLNDLDGKYYSMSPRINKILRSYIRSHPENFKRR